MKVQSLDVIHGWRNVIHEYHPRMTSTDGDDIHGRSNCLENWDSGKEVVNFNPNSCLLSFSSTQIHKYLEFCLDGEVMTGGLEGGGWPTFLEGRGGVSMGMSVITA